MTESEAIAIVAKHAQYHKQNPLESRYSVRWPEANPKALFSDDTADLVKQLVRQSRHGGRRDAQTDGADIMEQEWLEQEMRPTYVPKLLLLNPTHGLKELLDLPWLSVTEARQELFMSDKPRSYTYGKSKGERTYQSIDFSGFVEAVRVAFNAQGCLNYNICFLNRYEHQHHQLGWHADDSPSMDHKHPITVVSFGDEREIWWRTKGFKGVIPKNQRQLLAAGSLFIMPAGFQMLYEHRIPKNDRACGPRISLTFRRYID